MVTFTLPTGRGGPGAALAVALVVATAGTAAADDAPGTADHPQRDGVAVAVGPLRDLQAAPGPLDQGHAAVLSVPVRRGSVVLLSLRGVRAAAGRTFGAHVHAGPCVEGDPAAALGHYAVGTPPSPATEVWLDVRISRRGTAHAVAAVPFRVRAGERSVVLHERPTDPAGAAGSRLACLPVTFS